jgi:hypothetical protein
MFPGFANGDKVGRKRLYIEKKKREKHYLAQAAEVS